MLFKLLSMDANSSGGLGFSLSLFLEFSLGATGDFSGSIEHPNPKLLNVKAVMIKKQSKILKERDPFPASLNIAFTSRFRMSRMRYLYYIFSEMPSVLSRTHLLDKTISRR
jgi:hypothetical protein